MPKVSIIDRDIRDTFPKPRRMTPIKAIRLKCLDCCCGSSKEVELCTVPKCTLWPYRFGKRPATAQRRGKVTERPENEF